MRTLQRSTGLVTRYFAVEVIEENEGKKISWGCDTLNEYREVLIERAGFNRQEAVKFTLDIDMKKLKKFRQTLRVKL
jgi:hypothetical protein